MSAKVDMTADTAVTLLLKSAASNIQKLDITLVDLIAYVSSRPFNMKGQEFEEIIGFMLNREFSSLDKNAKIKTQSDKKSKDLIFSYGQQNFPFSIKNYTISRFQISTYAKHLDYFKKKYVHSGVQVPFQLDHQVATSLIDDLLVKLDKGITLFALTNISDPLEFSKDVFKQESKSVEQLCSMIQTKFYHDDHGKKPSNTEWLNEICSGVDLIKRLMGNQNYDSIKPTLKKSCEKFAEMTDGDLLDLSDQQLKSLIKLNRDVLVNLFPENTPPVRTNEDLLPEVDIYLRTLNRENFLDDIDSVVLDKTNGKTSHYKFWFYKKSGVTASPIFSLDLGQNALNRGLWFTNGKKHFGNVEADATDILNNILNEVLTKTHENMSVWNGISDNERIEHFLEFLKLQKTESALNVN